MHPILVRLGPFTIYSYGVMVALGFGLATLLIYARASKFHLDKDKIIDLAIIVLIAGVIGARAAYILLNMGYYLANPIEIIDLSRGGLVWYGGFLAGLFTLIFYIRKKGLDFWNVTDLFAPYIALAQGFGRIGCFLNGCCYGIPVPAGRIFSVTFPYDNVSRHPVEIYSMLSLFLIFALLRLWQDKRRFAGEIFLGYCALYSSKRFLIEFLRGDNPKILFGLTISQLVSIVVFLTAAAIFLKKTAQWKKRPINSR